MTVEESAKYFGWLIASSTLERGFDLGFATPALSPEVIKEFDQIVGDVCKLRPVLIDYKVLVDEYAALQNLETEVLDKFGNGILPALSIGSDTVSTHAICERRLSGFLNSASALRDRCLSRISKNKNLDDRVNTVASKLYDSSFPYRLCYNLRNLSQHHESPFAIIPVKGSGSEGYLTYSIELCLIRDELLKRAKKMQSRVRQEIADGPERIQMLPLAKGYFDCMVKLTAAMLSYFGDEITTAYHYRSAVIEWYDKMPVGATPVIFNGRPSIQPGVETQCSVTSFSFDELDMILSIFAQAAGFSLPADSTMPSAPMGA